MLPPQGNHVAFASFELPQLPLGNLGLSAGHALHENADRHDETDALNLDVNPTVSDFVFGNLLNQSWQRLQRLTLPPERSEVAIRRVKSSHCKRPFDGRFIS